MCEQEELKQRINEFDEFFEKEKWNEASKTFKWWWWPKKKKEFFLLKKKVEHQEIIDGDDDEKIDISIEHFKSGWHFFPVFFLSLCVGLCFVKNFRIGILFCLKTLSMMMMIRWYEEKKMPKIKQEKKHYPFFSIKKEININCIFDDDSFNHSSKNGQSVIFIYCDKWWWWWW